MKFSAHLSVGTTVLVAWAHGAAATSSNAAAILVGGQEASKSSSRNSSTFGLQSIMDTDNLEELFSPRRLVVGVEYVGNPCTSQFSSGECDECTGDCDRDSDCAGNLRCTQRNRSGLQDVPGCPWPEGSDAIRNDNDDFCFMPVSAPGQINYVGECSSGGYQCGHCEGDCDRDSHCKPGLVCSNRLGFEAVEGCFGEGGSRDVFGKDVCVKPLVVEFVGNPCTSEFDSGLCEICTGDCDSDSDCAGELRCISRNGSGLQDVPGCSWPEGSDAIRNDNDDFCFMPVSAPGQINYVGECSSSSNGYLCGECEGDCDNDSQCAPGLVCSERSGFEAVVGCSGEGGSRDVFGKDVCVKPLVVEFVGNPCTSEFDSGLCEICTGDCDYDSDCAGDLRCAQRSKFNGVENVPGCAWADGSDLIRNENDDYCFQPTQENGVINYVGECGAGNGYLCGLCEGDCDTDADCEDGLSCMSRDNIEPVVGCSGDGGQRDVWGKDVCFNRNLVVFPDSLTISENGCSPDNKCPRCEGGCTVDADCADGLLCFNRSGLEYVPNCVTGGAGDMSDTNYCYLKPPNGDATYIPGDVNGILDSHGLDLSTGLQARLVAQKDTPVAYADEGTFSSDLFHSKPDGAAVFAVNTGPNDGGWIYVSNSETKSGGVGAITFNSAGLAINYEMIVTNTVDNCGGGKTYWNTWVTCEEDDPVGQVWEVDPFVGISSQQQTVLGGLGGSYESFAYDARDRLNPTFYVTNDISNGGLVKFTPDQIVVETAEDTGDYSNMLTTAGTLKWLKLAPTGGAASATSGTFEWTLNRDDADQNAYEYYKSSEGIDIRDGILYMTTKISKSLFILDLDNLSYIRSSTTSGSFEGQPDQVQRILAQDPSSDMLYFCEESSSVNNGIHARDSAGNFYTIFNGPGLSGETTGLAFSPDNKRMYVSYQSPGKVRDFKFDILRL